MTNQVSAIGRAAVSSPAAGKSGAQPDPADIDFDGFRAIMGSFASGISIVTSVDDEGLPCGMTCSAVCSVSADPPLLLSCVKVPSATLRAIEARSRFAVNFLDSGAGSISDLFASRAEDKFTAVGWRFGNTAGMPLLDRSLAYAECVVHHLVSAGDHVIVVGRIVGGGAVPDRSPLGYWRGNYVHLSHGDHSRR
jgi:flavin reductase (DIM6/NTAB) family NADH-FMN oxidoreductase RutF